MSDEPAQAEAARIVAPVTLDRRVEEDDAVSHSLAVLATVYHYNHWIFASVRNHLRATVVEVGAGLGNITQFLLNRQRVVCLEPFEPYRRHLRKLFEKHLNVEIYPHAIEECPNANVPAGEFLSVVCLNVIEHIRDDVDAIARMRRLLRPGGRVILLAPAMPCLYGELDRAMGHVRRYTLGSLRRACVRAGLRPTHGRYMNAVGALGWWWRGCIQRKSRIPASATRLFDRLVPFVSAAERLLPVLFGQSVLVVGEA